MQDLKYNLFLYTFQKDKTTSNHELQIKSAQKLNCKWQAFSLPQKSLWSSFQPNTFEIMLIPAWDMDTRFYGTVT